MEIESNKLDKENIAFSKLKDLFAEYMLSEIQCLAAFKIIKESFLDDKLLKIRKWVLNKINNKIPDKISDFQKGCPDICPGIRVQPFYDYKEFGFIQDILDKVEDIKFELLNLKNNNGFQPYKSQTHSSDIKSKDGIGSLAHDCGEWNVFYLFLHEISFEENCLKCPKTVEIIQKAVPRQYYHCFFSAVAPNTHIISHNGPTNRKLRIHIPLINVDGSRIRVGDEIIKFKENVPVVFDDSFNHESWHDGDKTRINLILDFWHPDLSDNEVKFFKMLQQARLKNGKKYLEMLQNQSLCDNNDDYFSIIEKSKEILKNNDWWIG